MRSQWDWNLKLFKSNFPFVSPFFLLRESERERERERENGRQCGDILAEELKVLGGVKGDLVFIKDELEGMRAFLRVADAMERSDPVLQTWVKQVRDVVYDTDDVLEEFMLRLASYHRRGLNGFLCKIYYEIKSMRLHRQIAYEIRDITVRVTDIKQRHQRYNSSFSTLEQGLSSHVANNAWYDRRGDALLLEEAEPVGIDKPKQLINWLLDGDSPLKVISVEGMGRLGKTTLVKKVYEDKKVKRHFQNHAWITVSQFKIEELLKDLIQQLFNEVKRPVPEKLETMDNNKLKAMLSEFLQESRYVLVLDDVWSIDVWDAIKIALPNSNCGSHVLLTTRIGNVASISCRKFNGYVHKMEAFVGDRGSCPRPCRNHTK